MLGLLSLRRHMIHSQARQYALIICTGVRKMRERQHGAAQGAVCQYGTSRACAARHLHTRLHGKAPIPQRMQRRAAEAALTGVSITNHGRTLGVSITRVTARGPSTCKQ